jgi:hydrogenase/urease accessory protein HupE
MTIQNTKSDRSRKLLLAIVCLAYTTIGFSASLIGVAWPAVEVEMALSVEWGAMSPPYAPSVWL